MTKPDFCKRFPVGGTFREADQTCSVPDPDDGLPLLCVGPWAEEKHARIEKYVDISRAVRRKFINGKGGAAFVDLFSGPGRARIRETERIVDGSPVVAARKAIETKTPFSEVHVSDANPDFVAAVSKRLEQLGVAAKSHCGAAETIAPGIAGRLSQHGLHFAFLDPYDLKSLPFSIVQRMAAIERMDMLIHVSVQDLQRNLRRYIGSDRSPLDSFAPDWRQKVQVMNSDATVRAQIFAHWLELVRKERMQPSQGVEEVTGPRKQHLYWLVFVARHKLAIRFWEEIRNVTNQKSLGF